MVDFPMPNLEDVIVRMIAEEFFEPKVIGYTTSTYPIMGANGQQQMFTPQYGLAPMQDLANKVIESHSKAIFEAIWKKLDLDAFSDKVVAKLLGELETRNYMRDAIAGPEMSQLREEACKRVVDQLAQRQLNAIDAEEARQRREQARKDAEDDD